MEKNEISEHQVRIFLFVKQSDGWLSNVEIAKGANVANRTARMHTKTFVDLGLFDHADVFPGHRFKYSEKAEMRNKAYCLRLEKATEVLGLGAFAKVSNSSNGHAPEAGST